MVSMATLAPPPFVPVHPHRPRTLPPVWAGFFGERLRNSVYGWTEAAFEMPIFTRRIMGLTVHFVNDPAAIERVLLTNKPNYLRPGIARRLLRQVLEESLRLYPPAPRFDREAQAADRLGDVAVERVRKASPVVRSWKTTGW